MFRGGGDSGRGSVLAIVIMIGVVPILAWNLHKHRQEQKEAVKKGKNRQTWFTGLGGSRFNQALQWDAVFCYLTFLGFAYRETRTGRARFPFGFYVLISTLWGVSPALPLLLWQEASHPVQTDSAGEHKGQ